MSKMNRRDFLKISSVAGLGLVAGVPLLEGSTRNAYYLISDQPEADTANLLDFLSSRDRISAEIITSPVKPAAQDLTVIQNGSVIDPRSGKLNARFIQFSKDLRARRAQGHTLITIGIRQTSPKNSVRFEQDGRVIDQIDLRKNYNRIEMPGMMGKTAFQLQNGQLSVLESSCRHDLCAKMGSVKSGKIICAPNRLVATVNSDKSVFDGITG